MEAVTAHDTIREKLIIPLAYVTMLAWLVSLGDAVLAQQLGPITAVTPVMLLLAGYVFGANVVRFVARSGERNES